MNGLHDMLLLLLSARGFVCIVALFDHVTSVREILRFSLALKSLLILMIFVVDFRLNGFYGGICK